MIAIKLNIQLNTITGVLLNICFLLPGGPLHPDISRYYMSVLHNNVWSSLFYRLYYTSSPSSENQTRDEPHEDQIHVNE